MKLIFLVALLLAGCASPAGPGPKDRPGKPNPPPARAVEPVPAAEPAPPQVPQRLQLPQIKNGWVDISGGKRDDAALFQDSAACQTVYQQALATAWQLYPEPISEKDCHGCGTRNAKAVIARQQNVSNYAYAAYADCMEKRGWRKQ